MSTSPNKDDFIKLIAENQGILHKVVGMYCKHHDERDDVFQEILAQLWKSFPNFRFESKLSTWMYRVALNTAISYYRKEKKNYNNSPISVEDVGGETPEYSEDKQIQRNYLYQAIDKLSKVEKAIILLYLEERSYEEISEIMGITITNVGVKINRIKNKLKDILNPVSDELR